MPPHIPPMRNLISPPGGESNQVCLECDGVSNPCDCVRFERYGAVFDSPCKLELMADLSLCIEWNKAGCRCRKMRIEGVVVGCRNMGNGCFEISVLFTPDCESCTAPAFTHSPN